MTLWAHVPTPLATGESSLFVVIENLCAEHAAAGGASTVVVSDNRNVHVENGNPLAVDYTRYCPREWFTPGEMRIDHIYGLLGKRRPHSSRIFVPAVEALGELRPEVVFLHEGHHATPSLPLWAEALPETQLVLYTHIPFSRGYSRHELRRLLAAASGVIFVSRAQREHTIRFLGDLPSPVGVVNNGVNTQRFRPRPRDRDPRFRLTYVGEIHPNKGLHLLIAALRRIRTRSTRTFSLRIVGQSRHQEPLEMTEYEQDLRAATGDLGMEVEWLGRIPHAAMPAIYQASDAVCVPSVWREPFGMVVLEAMACGAAVIASPAGGLRDAGGDAAVYVEPTDDDALASAIADLAHNPDHLRAVQTRSLDQALRSTWKARYEELQGLLAQFRGSV
jgi:glycosyltransferase involved in cell wall biosynthesis